MTVTIDWYVFVALVLLSLYGLARLLDDIFGWLRR